MLCRDGCAGAGGYWRFKRSPAWRMNRWSDPSITVIDLVVGWKPFVQRTQRPPAMTELLHRELLWVQIGVAGRKDGPGPGGDFNS